VTLGSPFAWRGRTDWMPPTSHRLRTRPVAIGCLERPGTITDVAKAGRCPGCGAWSRGRGPFRPHRLVDVRALAAISVYSTYKFAGPTWGSRTAGDRLKSLDLPSSNRRPSRCRSG
jgi:hypothetical protein